MGSGNLKFFQLREALLHQEFSIAINTRVGDGFIKGDFRRPLRNRVMAFGAFIQANLYGLDFMEGFGGAFYQQICQSWRGAGVDQRGAILGFKTFGERELFGLEGIARQVRAQVQIMCAQPQRGTHYDLIEDGGRSVDDQLAAARCADDAPQITRVHFRDGNGAFLAEEPARAGSGSRSPHQTSCP